MDRKKILIADGAELHRAVLTGFLCDRYEIASVSDPERAIDVLSAEDCGVSLVLAGLSPETDSGFHLLEHMQEAGLAGKIPAVAVMDKYENILVARANMLGAAEYIFQPFSAAIIRHRVDNIIRLYAASGLSAEG